MTFRYRSWGWLVPVLLLSFVLIALGTFAAATNYTPLQREQHTKITPHPTKLARYPPVRVLRLNRHPI